MLERILYQEKNGTAVLYRCFGTERCLKLPSKVDGLPVTELGDHCFAPEMSVRVERGSLVEATRHHWDPEAPDGRADDASEICGDALSEIVLPESMTAMGDYCFYGCEKLEKIYFPAGFRRLGGGCLVDAPGIRTVQFELSPGMSAEEGRAASEGRSAADRQPAGEEQSARITPAILKDVAGEISYEFRAEVVLPDGQVLYSLNFPGYCEVGEENTPARKIIMKYEGMGYKYRQSFRGHEIDFHQYDSLFYETTAQELVPTILRTAFTRLMYPVHLGESAKEQYVRYLQEHENETASWIFSDSRAAELRMLCSLKPPYFSEEVLDDFLSRAAESGQPEFISLLMEYKRTHFRAKRKRYSF